jgi:hypothetical protein
MKSAISSIGAGAGSGSSSGSGRQSIRLDGSTGGSV